MKNYDLTLKLALIATEFQFTNLEFHFYSTLFQNLEFQTWKQNRIPFRFHLWMSKKVFRFNSKSGMYLEFHGES